ncbi:MAG: hypothetical protein B7Y12_02170 [Rhizobiales bacterium 24-66-13]|jgi:hypothetical protein|nr:MAG: hypothetical protein B7Z41_03090 [Rhizobiales bacterium 12-66-7]OYY88827.1 MAG: hypothetical protein B7Y61_01200 [Rhizobiales bacterium 35-66-30]OYZ82821.1 MAG: hypothetical protein B7Y12_02170 [Rhizobiales bacterium 24-66-13]OZB11854.1 MAG: hypothetical protein B7X67_02150 [Rhizobiales bacterium 39-66-18]HQS08721.1 hypothetical protein [Xanthobacteraceae bacterium]
MILSQILERLRTDPATPFALVEGAAELAALSDAPAALPALYVFVKEEASAENTRGNGTLQRTEMDLGALIITGNVADATGGAAAEDLEQLKTAVRNRLVGWQAPSADDAITHVGGTLVRARGGTVWWEMTLATAFYLTDGDD